MATCRVEPLATDSIGRRLAAVDKLLTTEEHCPADTYEQSLLA